jgi:hypothetical protein
MRFADLRKKRYFRVIFCIISLLLVLICGGYLFMERILFPSPFTGKKVGNLTLNSGTAILDALWIKAEDPKFTILYSHGNGEHLDTIGAWLEQFARRNYNVLAYDYAGYGGSSGKAGEKQACRDIEAAYRFLVETENIPPDRIVVIGFSVGSGPSTHIATKYPVRGLILAAPFASAIQVVLPFSLPGDRFRNAELLGNSPVPVLIFHGTSDRIVPFRNGRTVFERAAGRKKLVPVPGSGHNDLFDNLGEEFWTQLESFCP